jgi:hypothetical protein
MISTQQKYPIDSFLTLKTEINRKHHFETDGLPHFQPAKIELADVLASKIANGGTCDFQKVFFSLPTYEKYH